MAWLLHKDRVVASIEIADTWRSKWRGLLGRDFVEGAMLIQNARSVHTIGMRFPIDVAHCDAEMCVLKVTTMKPWRIGRFVFKARCVIEAESGAFKRWEIGPGCQLKISK